MNIPLCEHRQEQSGKTYCTHDRNISKFSIETGKASPIASVVCSICTFYNIPVVYKLTLPTPLKYRVIAKGSRKHTIQDGVGTRLKERFIKLGVDAFGCGGCSSLLQDMNEWGTIRCREQIELILGRIKANKKAIKINWATILKAGSIALREGMAITLRGLVEDSIKEQEEIDAATSKPLGSAPQA